MAANLKNPSSKGTSNTEALSSMYAGVAQNLTMLHDADSAVENKLVGLFAASIVILTLLLDRTHTWRALTIIGVILLSLAVLGSLIAVWSRSYSGVAVKVKENTDYLDKDNRDLLLHLISDAEDASNESSRILTMKAKIYNWVLVLFTLGLISGLLSFYVTVAGI